MNDIEAPRLLRALVAYISAREMGSAGELAFAYGVTDGGGEVAAIGQMTRDGTTAEVGGLVGKIREFVTSAIGGHGHPSLKREGSSDSVSVRSSGGPIFPSNFRKDGEIKGDLRAFAEGQWGGLATVGRDWPATGGQIGAAAVLLPIAGARQDRLKMLDFPGVRSQDTTPQERLEQLARSAARSGYAVFVLTNDGRMTRVAAQK